MNLFVQILLAWLVISVGLAYVFLERSEFIEWAATSIAAFLWPVSLVMWMIGKYCGHKREKERQERITAKVATGEYTVEEATRLKWKGKR